MHPSQASDGMKEQLPINAGAALRANDASATLTFDEQVPVTMVINQRIKTGLAEKFEEWLHSIASDAMLFEGHLGVNVIRPSGGSREYATIFRFSTPAQLNLWLDSEVRARRLKEAEPLCDGSAVVQQWSGLETWFSLPDKPTMKPPPRYKMACVAFIAVVSLLLVIPRLAAPVLEPLPQLVRMVLVSAAMVGLMTYVVMPLLTRLLYRWLYPRATAD